jgi:hypothetical protein
MLPARPTRLHAAVAPSSDTTPPPHPAPRLHSAVITGKRHSFIGCFKFVGANEYIQITFVDFGTDTYNVIFIGLGRDPMNIWIVQFDFDQPHIFVDDMTYIHRLTDEYIGHMATITGPPIFVN